MTKEQLSEQIAQNNQRARELQEHCRKLKRIEIQAKIEREKQQSHIEYLMNETMAIGRKKEAMFGELELPEVPHTIATID